MFVVSIGLLAWLLASVRGFSRGLLSSGWNGAIASGVCGEQSSFGRQAASDPFTGLLGITARERLPRAAWPLPPDLPPYCPVASLGDGRASGSTPIRGQTRADHRRLS